MQSLNAAGSSIGGVSPAWSLSSDWITAAALNRGCVPDGPRNRRITAPRRSIGMRRAPNRNQPGSTASGSSGCAAR